MVARSLDHKPLIALCGHRGANTAKRKRLFKYEDLWDLERDCSSKVANLQRGQGGAANPDDNVHLLKQCQQGLKQWSVGLYNERHAEINRKSERLRALQDVKGPEVMKEIKQL